MPRFGNSTPSHAAPRHIDPLRLGGGLVALAAFTLIGQGVRRRRLRKLDRTVRRAAHPKRDGALTTAAYAVCSSAKPHVHPLIASAIAAAAWPRIGKRALLLPTAAILSTMLDRATREVVQQHRPPRASHHPGRDRYAFPSGHTTAATAIALVTAIELRGHVAPASRRAIQGAAAVVPVMVGAARIYLDEHWADDVLGGWLAGTAIACILTGIMPGE